jgi:hypothetical protein
MASCPLKIGQMLIKPKKNEKSGLMVVQTTSHVPHPGQCGGRMSQKSHAKRGDVSQKMTNIIDRGCD